MTERILVTGPGWSASVDVEAAHGEPSRRSVAMSGEPPEAGVGLEIVHGAVVEFELETGGSDEPIRTGSVAIPVTLMLERGATAGTATNVGGSIDYRGEVVDGLLARLGLAEVGAGIGDDVPTVSLHPRGYTVLAAKQLPWEDGPLAGRFLVAIGEGSSVTLEQDVLEPDDREAWLRSWLRFATAVNPGNPLLRSGTRGEAFPAWLTLEVASVTEVPTIAWTATTPDSVRIGPSAVRILITEAAPYRPQRSGSVAILEPSEVLVSPTVGGVRVDVRNGQMIANDRRLHVSAVKSTSDRAWEERIVLDTASLEPDPVLLAARLRAHSQGRTELGCLTASTILDSGVLEIPVFDLTEQHLVDAGIVPPVDDSPGAVRGAVVVGNQTDRAVGEHPWSMTFSGASAFTGTFELTGIGRSLMLSESKVEICDPGVVVNGLWWIAAAPHHSPDMLPLSDDWVAPYRSEPLFGGTGAGRRRPSPLRFGAIISIVRDGERAVFEGAQELACVSNLETLDQLRAAHPDAPYFEQERFPTVWLTHPNLPVIQSLPMTQRSRPANVPVRSRSLFPYETRERSAWWVRIDGIDPSRSWGRVDPAALVPAPAWTSTSDLPVVFLSLPGLVSEPGGTETRLVYRHDLPALDEVAALTSTSPPAVSTAGTSGRRDAYWRELSTRARLAALQSATAFEITGAAGTGHVQGEVSVTIGVDAVTKPVEIDMRNYPGTITVGGADPTLEVGRSDSDPIAGFMSKNGRSEVFGGSERLRSTTAGLIDQFGVTRGETSRANGHLQIALTGADGVERRLITTVDPIALSAMGSPWRLWLRDLPMTVDGSALTFTRDPNAPFQGYEWRLGDGPLSLCGLEVRPIELRSFTRSGTGEVEVVIAARLTLPNGLAAAAAATAPDVVTLEFRGAASDPIALSAIHIDDAGTGAVWPTSVDDGGAIGGGPIISWSEVALDGDAVVVSGANGSGPTVEFFAFDRRWTVAMKGPLRFDTSNDDVSVAIPVAADTSSHARRTPRVEAVAVRLEIARDGGAHQTRLDLSFDAEDVVVGAFVDLTKPVLTSTVTSIAIFGESWSVREDDAVRSMITSTGFQVAWDTAGVELERHLLPGVRVDGSDVGGYASFVFECSKNAVVPEFGVMSAVTEMVLRGRGSGRARADLTAGYIASLGADGWERSLTVSGSITAENAFTFPFQDDDDTAVAPGPTPFGHIEHTATILFDQHRLPTAWLRGEAGEEFSCQAVVEHALVVDDDHAPRTKRSFVLNQAVTFAPPTSMADAIKTKTSDPHADEAGFGGPLHPEVASRLITALEALDPGTLAIDAGVGAWVDTSHPVDGPISMVSVRYRPDGTQLAAPTDIARLLDPRTRWDALALPFLSVLGAEEAEQALMSSTKRLLNAHDQAVLETAAMLSGRSMSGPVDVDLDEIDLVGGRRVVRLGPEADRITVMPSAAGGLSSVLATSQPGGNRTSPIDGAPHAPWLTHAVTTGPSAPELPDPLEVLAPPELESPVNLGRWKLLTRKRYSIVVDTAPIRGVSRTLTVRATSPASGSPGGGRVRKAADAAVARKPPRQIDVFSISVSPSTLTIRLADSSRMVVRLKGGSPRIGITHDSGAISVYVDGKRKATRAIPPRLLRALAPRGTKVELVWPDKHAAAFPTFSIFSQVLDADQLTRPSSRGPLPPMAGWVSVGSTLSRMLRLEDADKVHAGVSIRPPSTIGAADGGIIVSPYVALGFDAAPELGPGMLHDSLESVSTELLALGRRSSEASAESVTLTPIASKWWDGRVGGSLLQAWAAGVIEREVATSPVAIIRRREIRSHAHKVWVGYGFDVVDTGAPPSGLGWSGHQLRADPTRLVHAEPQFGGTRLPAARKEIDLAAPLVTDVRPIRSSTLGWSGLELVIEHSDPSSTTPSGLWDTASEARWMSLQHCVRFRDTESTIPEDFTAPATAADTVTADRPRLPENGDMPTGRPILPDLIRYVLVGNRPGAVLDLNAMITAVDSGSGSVGSPSGSVAVSHRMPRPLPLVGDDHLPQIVPQPADSVTHVPSDIVDSVVVSLTHPRHATITVDDTRLTLSAAALPTTWDVSGVLTDGSAVVPLSAQEIPDGLELVGADGGTMLRSLVGRSPVGTPLELRLTVSAGGDIPPRTVTLPLRVGPTDAVLVDTPRFVRFRDPAYDRLLTTSAVQATGMIDDRWMVTLACDRSQYGPASQAAFGFHTSIAEGIRPRPGERAPDDLTIRLRRVGADGRDTMLTTGYDMSAPVQSISLAAASADWREGDRLIVEVVRTAEVLCSITAGVLAVDPTPAPSSAYALLRYDPDTSSVRCVRYALGPRATKTEFVDLADLETGVVRRRATFMWTDVVRGTSAFRYAVQKITAGGSTHIPALEEFVS